MSASHSGASTPFWFLWKRRSMATGRMFIRMALWGMALLTLVGGWPETVRADRSGDNKEPAFTFYKQGRFFEAAMYYHRALRGLREVYLAFHWNGDPARYASSHLAELYTKLPGEMKDRVETCFARGRIGQVQRGQIEFLGDMWMGEMVGHDRGDMTTCCPILAPEAEKHGDFTAPEVIRRGEAWFYRSVAIPYHEKAAVACETCGESAAARLHRKAVEAYERRAAVAERIARGDKALMAIPGLSGPGPVEFGFYPKRPWHGIPNEYVRRRWWGGRSDDVRSNDDIYADRWKGPSPKQVAALLKSQGLTHTNEHARFSAVTVLSNLGEKEAVLSALSDPSPEVRLAAAKALAATRWAEGWAACADHTDPAARALMEPLLKPAGSQVLARTYVISGLVAGLDSGSAQTRSFCQSALARITGKTLEPDAWRIWWKEMGDARPGLKRTGGGIPEAVDERIDFGTWWQAAIQHAPNPLKQCQPPATVRWDGYLVVDRPGQYRFFVRNRGEGRNATNATGRDSLGLYFPGSCVKLTVRSQRLIPDPANEMLDPTGGVRLDFSDPIHLGEGLHEFSLEFEWRGGRTPGWWHGGQPVIRLYWSSEHFLRKLVPADHLIGKD